MVSLYNVWACIPLLYKVFGSCLFVLVRLQTHLGKLKNLLVSTGNTNENNYILFYYVFSLIFLIDFLNLLLAYFLFKKNICIGVGGVDIVLLSSVCI